MIKFEFDRFATLALCSLPYAGVGELLQSPQQQDLMRKALLVHFSYFLLLPILVEAFLDAFGLGVLIGPTPLQLATSNIMHMRTCLAAENFFVTSTALGMILLTAAHDKEPKVPRWTLMTPLAQLAWNLKNHISWFFMADTFAPEGPLLFAFADMAIIWPICGIYGYQFLYGGTNATTTANDKRED